MTKQKKNSRWQGYDPRYIYSLVGDAANLLI